MRLFISFKILELSGFVIEEKDDVKFPFLSKSEIKDEIGIALSSSLQ